MGNGIVGGYKSWRTRRLARSLSKAQDDHWSMPFTDPVTHQEFGWISAKPLFFTDETSFRDFVDTLARMKMTVSNVTGSSAIGLDAAAYLPFETIDDFVNAGASTREFLSIGFTDESDPADSRKATITFSSRRPSQKASTSIGMGSDKQLAKNLMQACTLHAKPMGFMARHRATPIVEPIDTKEESDRRNRWETNWKNIFVSAITGLLGGLVPLLVKTALHL